MDNLEIYLPFSNANEGINVGLLPFSLCYKSKRNVKHLSVWSVSKIHCIFTFLFNLFTSSKTIVKIMRIKMHLILGFFCLMSSVLSAQTPACKPDTIRYRDSSSGVYPLPYIPVTRPNGGIDKVACLTKAYNFVWTVKLGDTVNFPYLGSVIMAPVDSVTIPPTGGIQGLPLGITYACNPPNCVWKKKTTGCVVLQGTPTAANALQTYPLTMSGKGFPGGFYATLAPSGIALTFPGALAEGAYDLKLYAANDTRCTTASEDLTEVSGMKAVPNPTNGKTSIQIESTVSGVYDFKVTDLLGRNVVSRPLSIQAGQNTLDLDLTGMPNGIYMYSLSKGSRIASNKLIINQ
jgi:hypothetical protein